MYKLLSGNVLLNLRFSSFPAKSLIAFFKGLKDFKDFKVFKGFKGFKGFRVIKGFKVFKVFRVFGVFRVFKVFKGFRVKKPSSTAPTLCALIFFPEKKHDGMLVIVNFLYFCGRKRL